MEIVNRRTDDLIPYEFNNRQHPQRQIDRIANSISQFGFNQPIVVDENNIILVGHGRFLAAKKLGLSEVPTMIKTNLTETEKRAYRILDNKLQTDSTWDAESLQLELSALKDADFDFEPFGLDDLSALFPEEKEAKDDEFEVRETDETIIKPGDLLELGCHRLVCGDSTNIENVHSLFKNGEQADLVLTDPPYGVAYVGKTSEQLTVENDALDEEALTKLVSCAFDNAQAVSRAGAYWYATVPAGPLHILFAEDWKRRGILRQIMVWAKDCMVLGHSEYHYQHEPILFGWIPGDRHRNDDRTRTTVWQYARPKANREHPTMKPVELWAQAVRDGSREREVVYDPFLGSGTTLIAAEQLNRRCYGVEISPRYCQVIVDRFMKYCDKENKPFNCKLNGEDVSLHICSKKKDTNIP